MWSARPMFGRALAQETAVRPCSNDCQTGESRLRAFSSGHSSTQHRGVLDRGPGAVRSPLELMPRGGRGADGFWRGSVWWG